MLELDVTEAVSRRCYKCGETRPIDMFYVAMEDKRALREGRSRWHYPCRYCQRERMNAARKSRQDYVDAIKIKSGCIDCGFKSDHPEVYDFDHLPEFEKVASISTLLTKGTMDDLNAEIAKCEIVCANCHRIRTSSREWGSFGRSRGEAS